MKDDSGFTLIELLIVISVVGILTGIAVPNMRSAISNYRLNSAARNMLIDFQRARLEAVKRGVNVNIFITSGSFDAAGRVGNYHLVDSSTGIIISEVNMPDQISLSDSSFSVPDSSFPNQSMASFNSMGLPSGGTGSVVIQNDVSGLYRLSMSIAGGVRLQRSRDE